MLTFAPVILPFCSFFSELLSRRALPGTVLIVIKLLQRGVPAQQLYLKLKHAAAAI